MVKSIRFRALSERFANCYLFTYHLLDYINFKLSTNDCIVAQTNDNYFTHNRVIVETTTECTHPIIDMFTYYKRQAGLLVIHFEPNKVVLVLIYIN